MLPCLHCPTRSALPVALPACCLARNPHAALLAPCLRCLHVHCLKPTRALPARCLRCPRAASVACALLLLPARCVSCRRAACLAHALPARCLHRRRPARAPRALPAYYPHATGAARALPLRPALLTLCPHSPRAALSALPARALHTLQLLPAPHCPAVPEPRRTA
ncbi:unnamed protein product [Closterium sp. NIES-53]